MITINFFSLQVGRFGELLRRDCAGQDLIEYALMAGFVAVAVGAVFPDIASSANIVFSKVNSIMVLSSSS
jgi:Flp pilus assembly pilin Flp